jgi:hypothetical protein
VFSPLEVPTRLQEAVFSTPIKWDSQKRLAMFGKLKKDKLPLKIELFTIRWYSSNRSCANAGRKRLSPQQMPPLMVRKAEWRR